MNFLIIICLTTFSIFAIGCYSDPDIYIFDDNYTGAFAIVYNKHSNNCVHSPDNVFLIRDNRVLILCRDFKDGWKHMPIAYIGLNGDSTLIEVIQSPEISDEVMMLLPSCGSIPGHDGRYRIHNCIGFVGHYDDLINSDVHSASLELADLMKE